MCVWAGVLCDESEVEEEGGGGLEWGFLARGRKEGDGFSAGLRMTLQSIVLHNVSHA